MDSFSLKSTKKFIAFFKRDNFPQLLKEHFAGESECSVLDIGSNRGQFVKELRKKIAIKRAWLVEPQSELVSLLEKDFRPPVYSVHRVALTEKRGTVSLEISSGLDATASTLPIRKQSVELSHLNLGTQRFESVASDTLDNFFAEHGIGEVDLLKIDTQGNELVVLKHGTKALPHVCAVWVEMSLVPLYEGSCLIHEVVEFLHASGLFLRGLAPEFRGPSGELLQVNGLFTRN
jgi:FkbM family methyltransferase